MADPHPEIPPEQGAAAAEALEACRAEAVDGVIRAIYEHGGAGLEAFGERGRAHCREDLHHHLDYLAGSLVAGSPGLFGGYVVWLDSVLAARGVPRDALPGSLDLLRDFLAGRLAPPELRAVEVVLAGGRHALEDPARAPAPLGSATEPEAHHPWVEALAESLVQGSQARAAELVQAVAEEDGYLAMAVELVQPALYRVGEGWQQRRVSVAQEHLATALAQKLLVRQFVHATAAEPRGCKAVFACVASNHHSVGLRIVADAFELDGWDVDFLGADTPVDDLLEHIRETQPDLVGFSVTLVRQLPGLREAVRRIRAECGEDTPRLVAGGGGLHAVPDLAERLGLDGWHGQIRPVLEMYP